ncbi:MAG: DUF4129 domain-containing protein [Mameliella sp.]|nr:DUF4129 domain-containing protein [Phaeodactylibacter sp.]NRA48748.1 DUF4129 domain-containing protein [Phaeodactylibacter sp.]
MRELRHYIKCRVFWVLIALCGGSGALVAQTYLEQDLAPAEIDKENWNQAKEGLNYGSAEPRQRRERDEQSEDQRGGGERDDPQQELSTPEPWFGAETAALILRIFFWIIIAVLIAVLIRYLLGLKRAPRNPKIKKAFSSAIDLSAIEEDLPEAKLEDFLQEAISNGEYSLALRLYYLVLLQALAQKKQVRWKKDKTNRQYILELEGSSLQSDFRKLTYVFEQVWYGERQLDKTGFEERVPLFQAFAQRIQDLKPDYAQ